MKTPATPEGMTSDAPAFDESSTAITIQVGKVGSYVVTLPIDSIQIGDRFRQDLGDIPGLAKSIDELGLLSPIGIDRRYRLIYGHRRLLAVKTLGLDVIQARIIDVDLLTGEFAENTIRKDFTPSERVAIAAAIQERIGNRQGQRTDLRRQTGNDELPQNFAEVEPGQRTARHAQTGNDELVQNFAEVEPGSETREAVAKAAGFGNAETYRQAKAVTENAVPELVQAMDKGEIAISTAATLASAPAEVQRQAVAQPKEAPKLAKEAVSKPTAKTKTQPRPNAGRSMIAVRNAIVGLQPLEAMLSIADAKTMVNNYREAIARLVARFPELGEVAL